MAKGKKFEADYTVGDILSLYQMRKNYGQERRIRQFASILRSLCRMEYAVKIPDQYKAITNEVRTPFLRDAWHRITSSLIAKHPIVHAIPLNDKVESYREAANIAERADLAMIERINKERGSDIIYNLNAQLVRDGESVLKIAHRPQAWANFPLGVDRGRQDDYKKSAPFPIAWKDVDRLSIVCEDGEYGDDWIMEYGAYTTAYLAKKYRMLEQNHKLADPKRASQVLEGTPYPEDLGTSETGTTVKLEFFNDREWHVIIDGSEAPGWPKPNPYAPHLPYFRAATYDSESLLYSLIYLVPRLDELLTMKMNWAYLGAYANPLLESVPNAQGYAGLDSPGGDAVDGGEEPFIWTPGKAIEVPIGKKFSFASPPPVGRDINELTVLMKSLIDVAGIPSIMRGMSLSGDTGYLANQQMAAASMAYRIAAISAQRQLEKGLEFSHWLVSNVVKQTVFVKGWDSINTKTGAPGKKSKQEYLAFSPDESGPNIADLSKVGSVEVTFRPTLPTDEQARAMIALQVTNSKKPLYDRRNALEKWLQEEDPDGILEALRVEEALDQEPLRSMWIAKGLERAKILTTPSPASQLVNEQGNPLIPPGPNDINPVPLADQSVAGGPSVRGINQPMVGGGGRPPGMYPGQPGGPNG